MKKQILFGAACIAAAGMFVMYGCKKDDLTPPQITLEGGAAVNHILNQTWTEPGYTATDDEDGDITASVTISGSVNKDMKGTYTLTYSVSDAAGNTASATRTVTVYNQVDFVNGNYNVNENCSSSGAFSYPAILTASNTQNMKFNITHFGGFSGNANSPCTSNINVTCTLSGTTANSAFTWNGMNLCGNATLDGSAAFGGGTLTNASSPVQMTVVYRWNDGTGTETCTGMYVKQ